MKGFRIAGPTLAPAINPQLAEFQHLPGLGFDLAIEIQTTRQFNTIKPEIDCMTKGKAWVSYAFGAKISRRCWQAEFL